MQTFTRNSTQFMWTVSDVLPLETRLSLVELILERKWKGLGRMGIENTSEIQVSITTQLEGLLFGIHSPYHYHHWSLYIQDIPLLRQQPICFLSWIDLPSPPIHVFPLKIGLFDWVYIQDITRHVPAVALRTPATTASSIGALAVLSYLKCRFGTQPKSPSEIKGTRQQRIAIRALYFRKHFLSASPNATRI